ncbi:HAD-like protein [Vararia minispora EC-137]|uniref:HAD-like protein n=1 Tax=Vararia minispora EC-137 TaxID=1314806 RepID=A0ACB8QVS5_9AGAM|nr:HAD-like protein [Vararia minispora EC-137]
MTNEEIKAVIFDIGGVVTRSPLIAIAEYEHEHGIPHNYINNAIVRRGNRGAWQKFERGELPLLAFYDAFSRELSDVAKNNAWYAEYCRKHGTACPRLPASLAINGRDLFGRMMNKSASYDNLVISAIRKLRAAGRWRVIALTNNYSKIGKALDDFNSPLAAKYPGLNFQSEMMFLGWDKGAVPSSLRTLFDDFLDSSEVGMRKPEPEFYLLACKRNNIHPCEAVFLDDLGLNCKAASLLGMHAIRVPIGKSQGALKKLENLLGFNLLGDQQPEAPKL